MGRMNEIKIQLRSFKSSEHINEKGDGPYRGFGYLSLFSDPKICSRDLGQQNIKYQTGIISPMTF